MQINSQRHMQDTPTQLVGTDGGQPKPGSYLLFLFRFNNRHLNINSQFIHNFEDNCPPGEKRERYALHLMLSIKCSRQMRGPVILSIDINLVLVKKTCYACQGKLCFANPVHLRIDRVVVGCPQIGFFQDRVRKNCPDQITIVKDNFREI